MPTIVATESPSSAQTTASIRSRRSLAICHMTHSVSVLSAARSMRSGSRHGNHSQADPLAGGMPEDG
jgi:hypothetical protein